MKAFILAAGYGKRLRPITDNTPKPLIEVRGKTLLERHLAALSQAGIEDVVINVAYLAEQIADFVGNGARWNLRVRLSREGPEPLDTGGGMRRALALLGPNPFLLINADILCQFPLHQLVDVSPASCHLVLVDNPDYRASGDFGIHEGKLTNAPSLTYAGIGVFNPRLVAESEVERFSVVPRIRQAADQGLATAEHFHGPWSDVGTPERLANANAQPKPGVDS